MIDTKEKVHIIWTQDTEKLVTDMVRILKTNLASLWYDVANVLSHEINMYDEFASEETTIWALQNSVRWKHVRVVNDVNGKMMTSNKTWPLHVKYNDRLIQATSLCSAAKTRWSKSLSLISTWVFYSREDKFPEWGMNESSERTSPSAHFRLDVVLNLLAPEYYVTMHAHNPSMFKGNGITKCLDLFTWWEVQQAAAVLAAEYGIIDPHMSTMDWWWQKKNEAIASDLGYDNMTLIKERTKGENNKVEKITLTKYIGWRDVLLHDDILDTWWSFERTVNTMWEPNSPNGTPKSVNAVITGWMFNGNAIKTLTRLHEEGKFNNIFITNAIYRKSYPSFVKVLNAAPNFAEVIEAVFTNRSINFNMWVIPITK